MPNKFKEESDPFIKEEEDLDDTASAMDASVNDVSTADDSGSEYEDASEQNKKKVTPKKSATSPKRTPRGNYKLKTPRKMREPRPKLMKWSDLEWKKAVLCIVSACGNHSVEIPFHDAAQMLDANCSGGALQQAILKLRGKMVEQGEEVPPPLRMSWRGKNGDNAASSSTPRFKNPTYSTPSTSPQGVPTKAGTAFGSPIAKKDKDTERSTVFDLPGGLGQDVLVLPVVDASVQVHLVTLRFVPLESGNRSTQTLMEDVSADNEEVTLVDDEEVTLVDDYTGPRNHRRHPSGIFESDWPDYRAVWTGGVRFDVPEEFYQRRANENAQLTGSAANEDPFLTTGPVHHPPIPSGAVDHHWTTVNNNHGLYPIPFNHNQLAAAAAAAAPLGGNLPASARETMPELFDDTLADFVTYDEVPFVAEDFEVPVPENPGDGRLDNAHRFELGPTRPYRASRIAHFSSHRPIYVREDQPGDVTQQMIADQDAAVAATSNFWLDDDQENNPRGSFADWGMNDQGGPIH